VAAGRPHPLQARGAAGVDVDANAPGDQSFTWGRQCLSENAPFSCDPRGTGAARSGFRDCRLGLPGRVQWRLRGRLGQKCSGLHGIRRFVFPPFALARKTLRSKDGLGVGFGLMYYLSPSVRNVNRTSADILLSCRQERDEFQTIAAGWVRRWATSPWRRRCAIWRRPPTFTTSWTW
jgi:hypothetical protein